MTNGHRENTVGPWAQEKLDALQRYLEAYMMVMKNQTFRLVYIDAFAGAGLSRVRGMTSQPEAMSLDFDVGLNEDDIKAQALFIEGSPLRALSLARPFDFYRFIDLDRRRVESLEAMKADFPTLDLRVIEGEANAVVQDIAGKVKGLRDVRGVAFLDPYGAHLHWATLEALAATGKFDVIINFPVDMAINRLLRRDTEIAPHIREQLDRCFGCDAWWDAAYEPEPGLLFEAGPAKRADARERLLKLYLSRLEDLFGHVATPRLISNTMGAPLYYLLWAGSNARGRPIANHILKMGKRVLLG